MASARDAFLEPPRLGSLLLADVQFMCMISSAKLSQHAPFVRFWCTHVET